MSQRRQITFVVNALNRGGTERLVLDMARELMADHDLSVICLDEGGVWAHRLSVLGIPVHVVGRRPGIDLRIIRRLARLFRSLGTDIIHAHQCTAWFYCSLARLLNPRPMLLMQEHGRLHPESDSRKRRFINRLLIQRLTHRFVAVSDDVRARLVRYEGIADDRVQVIHNGVHPLGPLDDPIRTRLRRDLGIEADQIVIGTVARFDPIKNLPMLVASIEATCRRFPEARGLLVGDGPEFDAIRHKIAQAGLSDRIVLTGFRDDAQCITQCMDLFVLPSLYEGVSTALLDAMAAGVPVAVTAVGGNTEVVRDGVDGWVVPSGDAGELTNVLAEVLTDVGLRREMSVAARQRQTQAFDFSVMLDSYRRLYADMWIGQAERPGLIRSRWMP